MRALIAFGLALIFAGTMASAATSDTRAKMREACRADYERFCSTVQRGNGRIKQCMRDNRDRLTEQCRRALDESDAAKSSSQN